MEELIVKTLFKSDKNIWIVAPNYDLTGRIWDILYAKAIRELKPFVSYVNNTRGLYKIQTIRNTVIEAKSADDPKTLVGKGIDLLIIDEAGIVKEQAIKESLLPSLIDRGGRMVAIGTPKGKNWFYRQYLKGKSGSDKYASWRLSSYANNYLKKEEIDAIAQEMDEMERKQEIYAEFLEGAGQVFRNIKACIKGNYEEWQEGIEYVGGVDLAKHKDFTVIKIIRKDTRQVIFSDRFNHLDWGIQKTRIKTALDRYKNPTTYIDSTGIGDPIFDDLVNLGLNVQSYKYTQESKLKLIRNLSVMLENAEIAFPEAEKYLIGELEVFSYIQSPGGKFSYSAPEGLHDDEVNALMLAALALADNQGNDVYFL